MNLNHLRYFSVLAREEHYGRAAAELGISQPSLSSAISNLEQELGLYLFEKQGRNVRLTYYGRRFQEYVDQGLSSIEAGRTFMSHCADREQGMIRIGAVSSAGPGRLLPMLKEFLRLHPQIHFTYMDGTSLTLLEELKADTYDMVVAARHSQDPELEYYPLWEQRFMVIVPPGHPLTHHNSVTLAQVMEYPLIQYHSTAAARPLLDELFAESGFAPEVRCEVSDDYHIAGMVAAGLGVAIMVDSSMQDLFGLCRIPLETPPPNRNLYLALHKNTYRADVVEEFLRFIRRSYSADSVG